MKKIIAILLIAIVAVTLAACGAQNNAVTEPSGEKTEETGAIQVGGVAVRFGSELDHGELHFKDIEGTEKAGYEQAFNLVYQDGGEMLFAVRLVYFKGSTIDEVMTGTDAVLTEKTVNGTAYSYFEYDENGTPGHTYLCDFAGTIYTVSFVSSSDMTALEAAFLANVYFE